MTDAITPMCANVFLFIHLKVLEETGFNIQPFANKDDYIESSLHDHLVMDLVIWIVNFFVFHGIFDIWYSEVLAFGAPVIFFFGGGGINKYFPWYLIFFYIM